jgi:ATP-binding cassette, subfamily B, bacterial
MGIVCAMLWLDPVLAGVVLLVVPFMAVVSLIFQRWMLESSRAVRRSNARITSSFNEAISGVRTTKALAREADNLVEFQVESTAMFDHAVRNALQSAVYLPVVISLGSCSVALALWQGGVSVQQGTSIGTLVAFMQYATLFAMPIREMARQFTLLQAAQAGAERVQGLLETVPDIRSPACPVEAPVGAVRHIHFDAVDFAYKAGEPVLQGCSFEVRGGQTIALVGPTGGGKSTIVSLLARFYDVGAGAIRIDGQDIRDLDLLALQSRFGTVPQVPHLMSGTIADNIRYGRLDASDEAVVAAARVARAHEFIRGLPGAYGTEVGEGGDKLSTGQRQLVAMARAVLSDPAIFVMDEATSSVDTETERAIQAGLDAVLADRVAFVIAHRLSTIRSADRILVVQRGSVVESGSHEALVAQRGAYWRLLTGHAPGASEAAP